MVLTFPLSSSNRATSTDPHLRAIEMRTGLPLEIWARVAVLLATLSLFAVSEHVFVFRDTSLGDLGGGTGSHASAICCGVAVSCVRAHGPVFSESEGVVHELTVITRIDRVTVHFPFWWPPRRYRCPATSCSDQEPDPVEWALVQHPARRVGGSWCMRPHERLE